jgi:antitoxin component YwqK of YwqJK toxin-antitoxin module
VIALAIAAALAALPPPALGCPQGAVARGAAPPEGHEEWCEGTDAAGRARRDGPARTFYDDGGLWIEERFREGLRDGPFLERHRNGRPARAGSFARGARTGRWTIHFDSGAVAEESQWKDGVLHGPFVSFWPGGNRRAEGRHCGGAQCGTWRTFDEAGEELGAVEYGEQSLAP